MTTQTLDQIRAALKVVDYRYFGHYEFSDAQWEAFGILETFAKERLAALDAANADDELRSSRERVLRDALERAQGCINGLLKRTPVRDVTETLAEIENALAITASPPQAAPSVVDGWKCVPVEPIDEMLVAVADIKISGWDGWTHMSEGEARQVYAAFISTAPSPPK